jgi:hypothetical protein
VASCVCGVSRRNTWNCLGDVVRRINRGLPRRWGGAGWRSAATRHGFIACCGFGAGNCAALAWLVDNAGDRGAWESLGGVLRVGGAASGRAWKCLCSVLGYSCLDAGCCAHERWSLLCNEESVDAGGVEARSGQEACEGTTWKGLSDRGCTWLRHWTNRERTGRDSWASFRGNGSLVNRAAWLHRYDSARVCRSDRGVDYIGRAWECRVLRDGIGRLDERGDLCKLVSLALCTNW